MNEFRTSNTYGAYRFQSPKIAFLENRVQRFFAFYFHFIHVLYSSQLKLRHQTMKFLPLAYYRRILQQNPLITY